MLDCADPGCGIIPCDTPREPYSLDEMGKWQQYFISQFIQHPGEHLLEIGRTHSGKTQFLYWLVDLLREYSPKEAIVWFDIGKGDEFLSLLGYFGILKGEKIRIITLVGCELDIQIEDDRPLDLEFVTVNHCADVWDHILPGGITIASFEPFIEDDVIAVKETASLFKRLSHLTHRRRLYRPLTIIYDEFHNVCPAQGYGYAGSGKEQRLQTQSVNLIRKNVQKLRTEGVRLVCTTHQWTQLNRGVRSSFEWIVPRRGAYFTSDDAKLKEFNPLWRKMKTYECYIVLPIGDFSPSLRLPCYNDGKMWGSVCYNGIYCGVKA